jgi:hypothetical protein
VSQWGLPLTLWSLYNCYPDWLLILPSHLLLLVSCSADFGPRRWRWYVPLKRWLICGLHGSIFQKLTHFIKYYVSQIQLSSWLSSIEASESLIEPQKISKKICYFYKVIQKQIFSASMFTCYPDVLQTTTSSTTHGPSCRCHYSRVCYTICIQNLSSNSPLFCIGRLPCKK